MFIVIVVTTADLKILINWNRFKAVIKERHNYFYEKVAIVFRSESRFSDFNKTGSNCDTVAVSEHLFGCDLLYFFQHSSQ